MKLEGANVVITGGSRGIGAELARSFTEAGARVLVVARSEAKLAAVAAPLGASYLTADLTDEADVDALFARCVAELGHVDVWVNNAGVETSEAFVNVPREHLRELARLNFEAMLLLTRDACEHFLGRSGGHVVQLSSIAGAISFPGLAAYAGSKAGVTNFTESLRIELAGSGVGLTVVAPGPVDTEMWDRLENEDDPGFAQPALDRFRLLQFLPKLDPAGLADDIVDAVRHDKRHVRPNRRYGGYHVLNNAPRRIVELALTGVKLRL